MTTYAVLVRVVNLDSCTIEIEIDRSRQAETAVLALDKSLAGFLAGLAGVEDRPENALQPRGDTIGAGAGSEYPPA